MKKTMIFILLTLFVGSAVAQLPVEPIPPNEQAAWLESDDPQLAANKRIVFDFWREVLVGRNMERARELMAEDYIQHNPSIPTGRASFIQFFGRMGPGEPLDYIDGLVAIVAEDDLVTLAFVREFDHPNQPGETYTTTWFDMFRVENGMVAEHWDYGQIQ